MAGLLGRAIASWQNLARSIVAITTVVVLITGALWILNANLTIGPLSVTNRTSTTAAPAPPPS